MISRASPSNSRARTAFCAFPPDSSRTGRRPPAVSPAIEKAAISDFACLVMRFGEVNMRPNRPVRTAEADRLSASELFGDRASLDRSAGT